MPSLRIYRLFISHAWGYNSEYYRLVNRLNKARNFKWRNYSVPEHDPVDDEDLEEELREQIRPVQVVVILGGMYVAHSKWIQFEIDYAKELGKPILGIRPWGAQKMPKVVQDAADKIVGWNTPTIVQAIRDLAKK